MTGVEELVRCRPWIEAALEYSGGTHDFDDVVQSIIAGKMQLWPAPRGCAVTEIIKFPRKRVLHVFLAGGDLDQIVAMIDSAAAWGAGQGCSGLTLSGRVGWQRALAKHGFRPVMVTLEKVI